MVEAQSETMARAILSQISLVFRRSKWAVFCYLYNDCAEPTFDTIRSLFDSQSSHSSDRLGYPIHHKLSIKETQHASVQQPPISAGVESSHSLLDQVSSERCLVLRDWCHQEGLKAETHKSHPLPQSLPRWVWDPTGGRTIRECKALIR